MSSPEEKRRFENSLQNLLRVTSIGLTIYPVRWDDNTPVGSPSIPEVNQIITNTLRGTSLMNDFDRLVDSIR